MSQIVDLDLLIQLQKNNFVLHSIVKMFVCAQPVIFKHLNKLGILEIIKK
jgi:hypothetical protein